MKKTAAFLLSLSMLSASAVMAFADDEAADVPAKIAPGEAVINTVVPNSHKLTITVIGNGEVTCNGEPGTEFEVERLSEPVIEIKAREGEKLIKAEINGEDITDKLVDGKLTLEPMHEDKLIEVRLETELLPVDPSKADSSDSEGSGTDSSTTDSSKTDSKTSSTAPGNTNPSTGGVIGTISVGGLAVLGALTLIKRKNKDKE